MVPNLQNLLNLHIRHHLDTFVSVSHILSLTPTHTVFTQGFIHKDSLCVCVCVLFSSTLNKSGLKNLSEK